MELELFIRDWGFDYYKREGEGDSGWGIDLVWGFFF